MFPNHLRTTVITCLCFFSFHLLAHFSFIHTTEIIPDWCLEWLPPTDINKLIYKLLEFLILWLSITILSWSILLLISSVTQLNSHVVYHSLKNCLWYEASHFSQQSNVLLHFQSTIECSCLYMRFAITLVKPELCLSYNSDSSVT